MVWFALLLDIPLDRLPLVGDTHRFQIPWIAVQVSAFPGDAPVTTGILSLSQPELPALEVWHPSLLLSMV